MNEQKKGKKRSKAYYRKCAAGAKKAKTSRNIAPGMKGFLVTCNSHEKETVSELYNLLNEYADDLYGPEFDKEKSDEEFSGSSDEDDMEKAMAKEISAIREANLKERRFQNIMTKTKNVIFIRTTLDDPDRLVHKIFQDGLEKQVKKTRYAQRILPVNLVCKTDTKSLETGLTEVLKPHFETDFGVGIKYTAQCKIRYNNSISRTAILTSINKIIKEMNPLHTLCHDEPDLVIIVEVVMQVCCLSVVKDFFKFRKYNFEQIFTVREESDDNETEIEMKETNDEVDETCVNVVSECTVQQTDVTNNETGSKDNENDKKVDKTDVIDGIEETNDVVDETSVNVVRECTVQQTDVSNNETGSKDNDKKADKTDVIDECESTAEKIALSINETDNKANEPEKTDET